MYCLNSSIILQTSDILHHPSAISHQPSYHLPCILHFLPQHSTQYHLYILDERVMAIVITVQAHLVGVYHVITIPHRQFLIRHFVNLHLRKTSALRHQPSAFVPPSYFSPRFSPQTSDVIHPASLSLQPSYFSPRFSPQTSAFILQPSYLFSITFQSIICQRAER